MLDVTPEEFERLVSEELDRLPDEAVDGLENVAFIVEEAPLDGEDRFGEYDGIATTSRDQYGFGELPDRIVVFRRPHLESCDSVDELRDELHTTLVHEIGHYYGIDDDRLHELGWS